LKINLSFQNHKLSGTLHNQT